MQHGVRAAAAGAAVRRAYHIRRGCIQFFSVEHKHKAAGYGFIGGHMHGIENHVRALPVNAYAARTDAEIAAGFFAFGKLYASACRQLHRGSRGEARARLTIAIIFAVAAILFRAAGTFAAVMAIIAAVAAVAVLAATVAAAIVVASAAGTGIAGAAGARIIGIIGSAAIITGRMERAGNRPQRAVAAVFTGPVCRPSAIAAGRAMMMVVMARAAAAAAC